MARPDRTFERAEKARSGARYGRALDLYADALTEFVKAGSVEGILDCHAAVGDTLRMTGEFPAALRHYEEALALSDNPYTSADCRAGIGLCHRALGSWESAFEELRKANRAYRRHKDPRGHAFTTWALAGTHRIRGNVDKAIETFDEALELYRDLRDRRGIGFCYNGLGGANRVAGRPRESEKYYRRAHQIFDRLNDRFGTAYSHCGLGNARRMVNDYDGALQHFRRATLLYRRIGDRVSYAYTLWSLGTTHKMLGHRRQALRYFQRADVLFRETRDPRGKIYCQLAYGELRLLGNDATGARRLFRSGLQNAEKHGFLVEEAHARMLMGRNPHYERLGMQHDYSPPPHNIP